MQTFRNLEENIQTCKINSLRNENIPVKVDMAWQWGEEAAVRKSRNEGSPALLIIAILSFKFSSALLVAATHSTLGGDEEDGW